MKINNNKLMESLQTDFENAASVLDSLGRINKVPEAKWVDVLKEYVKWEKREMGENMEWDEMEMEKEDVQFIKTNNIKWCWMY
jgi:hypothetical protein